MSPLPGVRPPVCRRTCRPPSRPSYPLRVPRLLPAGKGDLCWKCPIATLALIGKAVELVNTCADKAACETAALS
ncbi:hypothetical protein [Streptomyces sp. NBC_01217]|uniref:hypothetical protein n=1 Tax=Streptomyces sp. NBC_01217 TaxID=2903779 RepID=UPI002E0FB2CF|nr:hypothetical protein OG507_02255 [Streptomyces sp. NBC_01217]